MRQSAVTTLLVTAFASMACASKEAAPPAKSPSPTVEAPSSALSQAELDAARTACATKTKAQVAASGPAQLAIDFDGTEGLSVWGYHSSVECAAVSIDGGPWTPSTFAADTPPSTRIFSGATHAGAHTLRTFVALKVIPPSSGALPTAEEMLVTSARPLVTQAEVPTVVRVELASAGGPSTPLAKRLRLRFVENGVERP